MSSFAALVSSSTALIATAMSLFLLRQGQVDRRALREERKREQANAVSGWADWHVPEFATFARPRLPTVFVNNSSASAVYDVFFDYRDPIEGRPFRKPVGPLPPGVTRLVFIEYEGDLEDGWEPASLHPRVYFRDAAGERWVRDAMGRLRADFGPEDDDFFENGGTLLPPA